MKKKTTQKKAPGRPAKKPSEVKSEMIKIRLTKKEKSDLKKFARQNETNMAELFRQFMSYTLLS